MKKTLTLLIVLLVCVQSALADSHIIASGGSASGAPAGGGGGGTSAVTAPNQPNTYNYYTGSGNTWTVTSRPLTAQELTQGQYQGYQQQGTYQLTDVQLNAIRAHEGKAPPTTINTNEVVFTNTDGSYDVSVGRDTYNGWTGPERFSSDAQGNFYYDNRRIVGSTGVGGVATSVELEGGTTVNALYGGAAVTENGRVTIYDAQNKPVNSFSEADWRAITNRVEPEAFVDVAYAIKDLGVTYDELQVNAQGNYYTDEAIISTSGNQVQVQYGDVNEQGQITGESTTVRYDVQNGNKQVTYYSNTNAEGQTTTYTYGTKPGDTWTINGRVVGTVTTYPNTQGTYLRLDTINGVDVSRDSNGNLRYFRNGKELTQAEADKFEDENEQRLEQTEAKNDEVSEASYQRNREQLPPELRYRSWDDFVLYYRQYSGMSGWSSLIFDEEFLAEWREAVNHVMCDILSLPTQQCWVSKICDKYTDIGSSEAGVAFVDGAGGVPQAFAHIEGERGLPIVLPNQTSWVYTVTFALSNPSDEDSMSFNVHFRGPKRSAAWWPEAQTLNAKETVSVLGASALMKMSIHDYTEACLEFSPSVETPSGRNINSICNTIVQYAGGATAPYVPPTNATTNGTAADGGASPGAPATPGASV
jgi:hypothetical protein